MNAVDEASTQRADLAALLADIERLEAIFETWDEAARAAVDAYRGAIEALHAVALQRLVRALKADPNALAAMKHAVTDEVVYAVLRHHEILKASLSEQVEAALASIRPMLASHGGGVELIKVAPPAIEVRFTGACDGCSAAALTFHAGVKKAVEEVCPQITEIRQLKGRGSGEQDSMRFVSPFALGARGDWISVGRLSQIPEGGVLATEIGGADVLLARQGSIVTCFANACAHLGFTIDGGDVDNGIITCPHHDFQYDLMSGECLTAPEVRLQAHAVRVIGQRVEVRLAS
jgi:nitrite reductase/ring-hydroxylating ferredoxin subunit/Fe-S cluster biogenesis protein NfuA